MTTPQFFRVLALLLLQAAAGPAATHPAEAAAWLQRASALADEARYSEAAAGYRQAIGLLEAKGGSADPALAQPLNDLAIVYRRLGRLRDAERCYTRSLELRPSTLVRVNLARLYQQMRRYGRARELLRKAIENPAGSDEPAVVAAARHTQAALLLATGELDSALEEASRAVQLWRLANRPSDAAKALGMRAEILRRMKRYPDAAVAFQRALPRATAALGERHPEVGHMLWAYSKTLGRLGRGREAKTLRQRAQLVLAAAPDRVAEQHIVDASEWLGKETDKPR